MNMPFGKYKGQPIEDLPTDYIEWLVSEVQMKPWLKVYVKNELRRRGSCHPPPEQERYEPPTPRRPALDAVAVVLREWHRALVMKWHPDRGGSNDSMKAVNDAYESLKKLIAEGDNQWER